MTLFYLFTFTINLWHRKFVAADVTAVCVNNQHVIQQQGQDFDKTHKYTQHPQSRAYCIQGLKSVHLKCNFCIFFHVC